MKTQVEEIIYAHLSNEELSVKGKKIFESWISEPKNRREYRRLLFLKKRFEIEVKIYNNNDKMSWNNLEKKLSPSDISQNSFRRILNYAAGILIPLLISAGGIYFLDIKDKRLLSERINSINSEKVNPKYKLRHLSIDNNKISFIQEKYVKGVGINIVQEYSDTVFVRSLKSGVMFLQKKINDG